MAAQLPTSWFTVDYDSLAREEGLEEFLAWQRRVLAVDNVRFLERFVTQKVGGRGRARFAGVDDGSYNMIFKFKFSRQGPPEIVLRFPKPGQTATSLAVEKLVNEVGWMEYMEEHHVLKVPHVHCWGRQGPNDMGPYIMMDFVEGERLLALLNKWRRSEDSGDQRKRDIVFEQLAEMYLRLHRQRFDRIGSITKTPEGRWEVTRRPLTLDMHMQVIGVPDFPTDSWPSGPLSHSRDYKDLVVDLLHHQLRCLRNLNIPVEKADNDDNVLQKGDGIDMDRAMEIARARWIARRAFAAATPSFVDANDDADGFIVFNCELHPRNILVNPETAEITAVLDFEGTNAMPAAFARDPPLWLDPWSLDKVLEYDLFSRWLPRFEAALGRFLTIMEGVESRQQQQQQQEPGPSLSARMRASWESKQCLVNFAAHYADYLDALYWVLPGVFPPPDESASARKEVEDYQAWTRCQIAAFESAEGPEH